MLGAEGKRVFHDVEVTGYDAEHSRAEVVVRSPQGDRHFAIQSPTKLGEIQVVGTTSTAEYRKNIDKDAALSRLFAGIEVEVPTQDEAVGVLRGIVESYEIYHGVRVSDPAVVAAVKSVVGELSSVVRVVKVVGFVASAPGFTGQPQVVNGASEFLGKIFGDAGKHARSAVGVAELPLGAPVEVELIVELR